MSFHNFLVKKSYIDMDYLYGKLSNSQGKTPWTMRPSRTVR